MSITRLASLLSVALAVAACGAAESSNASVATVPSQMVATTTASVGLFPGESMTFLVKLAGIEVGEAALAVGDIDTTAAPARITVHSKINSSGAAALVTSFVDEATTSIAVDTGQPISLATNVVQGKKSYVASATFTPTGAEVLYQKAEDPKPQPISFNFRGQPVHDAHSAMAELRNWHPASGEARSVFIVGGRRLWRIDLVAGELENVGTTMGNRKAQRLNGKAFRARADLTVDKGPPGRTFSVWMSDDGDRVPLRVTAETELGSVEISLQDYNRP